MTHDLTSSNHIDDSAQDDHLTVDAVEMQDDIRSDGDGAIADEIAVNTESLEGRKRRITAQTIMPYAQDNIWHILTDYDHLADFIPSLKSSRRIEHPENGIRIEQIGSQSLLKVKFCARVVLDMVETFPQRIDFAMVEGDFKEFQGAWILQPTIVETTPCTQLAYTLEVLPSRIMPVNLIERKLSHNLRINLLSIHQRAIALFGGSHL